ncbi:MAG: hypothetical protein GKS06_10115 [Acidobacteria bacterium]|nr:hypothetical protein [Acidobacteriota bacterium]
MSALSTDFKNVAIGTLVMAAVSTFADAFWAAALPEHRAIYGLAHGGIVLGLLGLTLAWLVGGTRVWRWGIVSLLVGVFAAVVFYGLYPFVGSLAMLVAWMGLWLAYAQIAEAADPSPEGRSRSVIRGLAAAVLSGIGFWMISGIWLGPHDPGPLYWRNFASWCVAFAPGMIAILGWRGAKAS